MRRVVWCAVVLSSVALISGLATSMLQPPIKAGATVFSEEVPYTTWKEYGGTPDDAQYSALKQIDRTNVAQLQQAWFYPVSNTGFRFGSNPIIVENVMYVVGKENSVVALNAATGKELWGHRRPRAPIFHIAASSTGRAKTVRTAAFSSRPATPCAPSMQETAIPSRALATKAASICASDSAAIPSQSARYRRARRERFSAIFCSWDLQLARSTNRLRATCALSTWSPARWRGFSTPCRIPVNPATTRGRLMHGSILAAPTPGANSPSMKSAASRTSLPARQPTTFMAPIEMARTCFRIAFSLSMRAPENISGTFRRHITTCGITISKPGPKLLTINHDGKMVDVVAEAGKNGFCMYSIE